MFVKLTTEQINEKRKFMRLYKNAKNAATGSTLDSNANVSQKNLATMASEVNKDINIQINRAELYDRIWVMYGKSMSDKYIEYMDDHVLYTHDETSLMPYCGSISMYPMLTGGLRNLGMDVEPPKNIESFCGTFINTVYAISAQLAGAVATVEFLMYFDYFATKTWGDTYQKYHKNDMFAKFQQVVHSLNQPAAARNYQSVFWNISIFDKPYFESLFGDFVFPDGTRPNYDSISWLQTEFMEWFNEERTKSLLTFPVVTAALLHDGNGKHVDEYFSNTISHMLANGNSFFVYQSDKADSLSSCCRLRNELVDNTFSYTLGAGGVYSGSVKVMTLNMNRIAQLYHDDLERILECVQCSLHAYRSLVEDNIAENMLPVYTAGFLVLDKQYCTVGINGVVEAAEFLGLTPGNNEEYMKFLKDTFGFIRESNKRFSRKNGIMLNTELVPAESLGVKFAKWDKRDGLKVNRDCYNSYFYPVEDDSLNIMDKLMMYNGDVLSSLDGGSALHLNLETYPTMPSFKKLLELAAKVGCNYLCTNVLVTICDDCGFIDKDTNKTCSKCGSKRVGYATRVIGYLKRISSFSEARQSEHKRRAYNKAFSYPKDIWA